MTPLETETICTLRLCHSHLTIIWEVVLGRESIDPCVVACLDYVVCGQILYCGLVPGTLELLLSHNHIEGLAG